MIENNKLIAEFLGRNGKINKSLYTWKGIDTLLSGGWVPIEQMKFYTDWNWLMQVVEKIYEMDLYYDKYIDYNSSMISSGKITLGTRIERVYEQVLEFIKWYNEQKTNKL